MESIVLASELDTSANTQDGSSATGLNLDVQNVAKAKVVEPPAPARITPKPFVPRMPPGLGMWSSSARSSNAPSGLGESLTIGLPPTEESQERIRKLNPGRYAFENPETARTFSNPKNVVDSFDDIENMGTFERLFKDTATSKDRGLKVLELSELGANLWQGEGYDPVSMAEIERVKREMKEIPDFGWENRDAGWVFNIPGQVAEMAPLSLHTLLSAQEAGLASGAATAGLGALAGSAAGGVGAGPGALSGFAYGYGTGTALSAVYAAGKAEAGLALIELKDLTSPDGILIPQDTAKALSLAVGTVNGLLETFALGKIVGTFPGGDKLLGQFSRGGVKQALQNPTVFGLMMRLSGAFAGSAAREGVTEGMQEGVLVTAIGAFMKASGEGFENFTHEVADPETGESVTLNGSEAFWARVFESAIAGAQGGGGMGLTGQALTETSGALGLNADRVRGAVKNLNNLSGVQKAGATLSRVMKMNKTASESTLRETNPEAYADHVKRSYPQGEIYISSEAVQRFMGNVEDPRSIQEIIASIEGFQAQIEDSAETGNDIVLSIEDYMLNVAHTPLASAISRHVRFTPEDMTAVQADAFKGSISGALEESGEAMLAELTESERAELDAKVDADQESLTESQAREDASAMIWGQLRGTYENSEASAFTEIALAQMEARADRKGLSLSQLIAQEGMPQIIGPGQELPDPRLQALESEAAIAGREVDIDAVEASYKKLFDDIREGREPELKGLPKTPVLSLIKSMGGVATHVYREGKWVHSELYKRFLNADFTAKRAPGLFRDPRKKGSKRLSKRQRKRALKEAAGDGTPSNAQKASVGRNPDAPGMTEIDEVAENFSDSPYVSIEGADSYGRPDPEQMWEAILDDIGGTPRRTEEQTEAILAATLERRMLSKALDDAEIDLNVSTNREAAEALHRNYDPEGYSQSATRTFDQPGVSQDPAGPPLVAHHNLSAKNLSKVASIGGLAMPSMAISSAENPMTGFGEITLIADESMVKPSRSNKVFPFDAYSPTYPSIVTEFKSSDDKKISKVLNESGDKRDSDKRSYLRSWEASQELETSGENAFFRAVAVQARFLSERGELPNLEGLSDDWRRSVILAVANLPQEYAEWSTGFFDRVGVTPQRKIFLGYTDSGTRRYQPETAKNVVAYMKRELRSQTEQTISGAGEFRARVASKFSSLKDIKSARDTLVSKSEMNELSESTTSSAIDIASELSEYLKNQSDNPFFRTEQALDELAMIASGNSSWGDWLENVPDDVRARAMAFVAKIKAMPSEYFEAKPERVVELSEFKSALVPEGDEQSANILRENGVDVIPYADEADRIAKLQTQDRYFFQPAFHGGPHRFDKFTTDAIGTGEGAQAFGWGLYFSSSRGIAEFYQQSLSGALPEISVGGVVRDISIDNSSRNSETSMTRKIADRWANHRDNDFGSKLSDSELAMSVARSLLSEKQSQLEEMGGIARDWNEQRSGPRDDIRIRSRIRTLDNDISALEKMIGQGIKISRPGQLFQVEIPEDNELMDWDAPLSEQIPKVQEIMLDFRRTMHSDNWMEQVDGQTLNRTISAAFADPKSRINKATGESFYRTMAEYYGGDAEVSKALSAAGIKGHKYQANQISGGPGTATNYVIYDENAIEIAKTFFQPERGSIDLSDPELRNVVIRLGEAADRSTFLHESGHLWLAQLDKDARVDGGEFAADLETIKAHMREAVGTDDVFSSEFQEQWASWTENYFMRGISPTKALRAVFKKFGAWLTKLYGAMENIPGFQGPLSPEIVEIMDRMFATQEQLKDEQVQREVSDLLVEEKDASKRAGVPAMALSEARGKAREIIENTQWRHLKPHKYRLAAAREGRLALEAAIQDDFAKSSMHKRRQVLNALLESDARRAKENGLKAANFANRLQTKRRLSRIGLAGQEYLQVILGLLNRFDLNVSRTIKEIENRKSLAEFIIERESEYDPIYISDKIRDEAFTKSWKELTIKELSELTDALKNIETIAVRQFEFNAAGQKEMQAEVRASLVDAIKKNATGRDLRKGNARLLDKIKSKFVGAEASLAKVEAIALFLDGLDPNGAWSQKVYQPVSDSVEGRNDLSAEKTEELNALWESYLKPRIEEYSKVFETPFKSKRTGKNVEMNMLEVLSLFLNIGNNGNVQRIEDGNGWKLQDVEAFVFSKMSREDYDFAKEASEIIGSLWPEIAADEARIAGIVPEKVIGRTIKTPFGDFQGAYFPIIYDPFHSMRAEDLNKKSINDGIVNPFASISGRPGAANERMRKVKDRAILFDLSVIPNHIDEIVSKVSTRDTLMQVHKLLKHEDIRRALQETTLGEEYFSLFEPWLMDIANDRVTESANIAGLNSFMKRIRLGETAGALAFRLSTLMGQPLGHSNAYGVARKMIPNYAKYHATVMSNPAFVAREAESVFEESATIRQRIKYIGREARDLSRSVDVGSMSLASKDSSTLAKKAIKGALTTEQKSKEVADFGMRLIGKLQVYSVDLPVYLAVQEAAIQELDMSPKDAQRLAEKVVRISQGGGDTKDLAAIQRGTELSKIFTVFYSYMSAVYNQAVTLGLRTVKDRGKAAILADLTFALIIPGITYDLMKAAMGGRGGPEDDADVVGYLKWLAQIVVSEAMGTVPVVREFAGAVTGQNAFGFEPSLSRAVKNMGTFLGSVREGDIEDAAWESLDVLRSFMYGFPPSYPVDKIEEFLRE